MNIRVKGGEDRKSLVTAGQQERLNIGKRYQEERNMRADARAIRSTGAEFSVNGKQMTSKSRLSWLRSTTPHRGVLAYAENTTASTRSGFTPGTGTRKFPCTGEMDQQDLPQAGSGRSCWRVGRRHRFLRQRVSRSHQGGCNGNCITHLSKGCVVMWSSHKLRGGNRRGLIMAGADKSYVICTVFKSQEDVLPALELAFDSIWADLTEEVMRFAEAGG